MMQYKARTNRSIKCNLIRPTCGNCARRNEVCTLYSDPSLSDTNLTIGLSICLTIGCRIGPSEIFRLQQDAINDQGHLTGNDSFSPLRPTNTDLYFLERYFSHICPTLSSRPETQRNWARAWTDSSELSKQPYYLTHLQIAISELQFCLTSGDSTLTLTERRTCLEDSIHHQNAALSLLRPVLGSTTAMQTKGLEEVPALFSASWLIFLFNLTFPRGQNTTPDWILDEIVELSELSKGVVAIILGASAGIPRLSPSITEQPICDDYDDDHTREAKARVMSGPLRPFFDHLLPWKHEDVPPSVRRQNISASAQDLIRSIDSLPETATVDNKLLYRLAIEVLEMTAVALRLHTQHPSFVFMWLIGTKRPFMELIKKRDVLALRILREYGLMLKTVESHWWTRGLGTTIIEGVDMALKSLGICVTEKQGSTSLSYFR